MVETLKKLILASILASNIGYTLFLLPTLNILYDDMVPLTIQNFMAFIMVSSMGGILLSLLIYLATHLLRLELKKAIIYSTLTLWLLYWIPTVLTSQRNASINLSKMVTVISLDLVAALITLTTLIKLAKK